MNGISSIATALILTGSALILLFVTQTSDPTILANMSYLWGGSALAVVGGFIKGWVNHAS